MLSCYIHRVHDVLLTEGKHLRLPSDVREKLSGYCHELLQCAPCV